MQLVNDFFSTGNSTSFMRRKKGKKFRRSMALCRKYHWIYIVVRFHCAGRVCWWNRHAHVLHYSNGIHRSFLTVADPPLRWQLMIAAPGRRPYINRRVRSWPDKICERSNGKKKRNRMISDLTAIRKSIQLVQKDFHPIWTGFGRCSSFVRP